MPAAQPGSRPSSGSTPPPLERALTHRPSSSPVSSWNQIASAPSALGMPSSTPIGTEETRAAAGPPRSYVNTW
jgi:hypothetical protein